MMSHAAQPLRAPVDTTGMPRKRVVIVLVEVDRRRWQGAADLRGVELERFVRDAVEEKIGREPLPVFMRRPES